MCLGVQVPKKKKELAKEIREKAAPLLNWLRTAEEESSSEEEDDVEVLYLTSTIVCRDESECLILQVEYSSKATGDSIITAESQPAKVEEEETGPDVDIDAI